MPASVSLPSPDAASRPGFYGKLPIRGDFLGAGLPRSFVEPWDTWLQQGLAASRERLGVAWLPAYLSAPIWRFLLAGGLCGERAAMGVMMSSVDKVGRYFPLVVAAMIPACGAPLATLAAAEAWLEGLERFALSALDEGLDLATFEGALGRLAAPPEAVPVVAAAGLRVAVPAGLAAAAPSLLDAMMPRLGPWSLWWTAGSEAVEASAVLAVGLPPADGFAAFLDGQWERWGWTTP